MSRVISRERTSRATARGLGAEVSILPLPRRGVDGSSLAPRLHGCLEGRGVNATRMCKHLSSMGRGWPAERRG